MTRYIPTTYEFVIGLFGTVNGAMVAYAQGLPPAVPGAMPPPPPLALALRVFYTVGGQTLGPLNAEQLKAKIAAGEIGQQTLVWMEGMAEWQAAATVAAIAPFLAGVPPALKFDATAYLVGTWEQVGTMPMEGIGQAQVQTSVTYRADGTLTGFGTVTSQSYYGPITLTISSQGTWTAQAKTEDSFVLTPNMQVTTSGATGVPSTSANNTPVLVTIIDRNTVTTPSGLRSHRVGP